MKRLLLLLAGLLLSISSLQAQNPGELDLSFNPVGVNSGVGTNQFVHSSVRQPDGKIISVGNFTTYNGIAKNRIIRLNPDGTLDSSFNIGTGANATIWTVVLQSDGKILIGGDFTFFNGVSRNRIARLNSDGSVDSNFAIGSGFNGRVFSIFIQVNEKILVGGDFSIFNGVQRPFSLRLESTGVLDLSYFPAFQSPGVRSIVSTSDGSIYLAGGPNFNIVKLTSSGNLINGWCQCNISGQVFSLFVQNDDKLLVGGRFFLGSATGSRSDLVRINPNGTIDTSFFFSGVVINNYILSISPQSDGKILIAGNFQTQRQNVARLNSNGSLDNSFNANTNAPLWNVISLPDAKAFIGGEFTSINGNARNYLAQLNADGSYEVMGAGANGSVWMTSQQSDGKVLIAGNFTSYNGISRNRIARLNPDGSLDSSFNPGLGANGVIYRLLIQPDGKILIAGGFSSFNGTASNSIARLNIDGSLDLSFYGYAISLNSGIYSMALQSDGKILIGGDFRENYGSSPVNYMRLNPNGTVDPSFIKGAGLNSQVYSIGFQPDGKILVGGNFSNYYGRNRIIRLNDNGTIDNSFNTSSGANDLIYNSILQSDGKILIGGFFTSYNGVSRNRIARLNADGSIDSSFDPESGANNSVEIIRLQSDGKILIGGQFTSFNGMSRNRVSRLNSNGNLDTTFDPGVGAASTIRAMTIQSDGKILIGGDFTEFNGVSRVRITRIYGGGEALDEESPVLDLETLDPLNAQCQVNFDDLTIPTATDLVDGAIQGTTDQSIFPITTQGTTTITWTYIDEAGNESSQTQDIIVDDTTAPVPALTQLAVVTGQCSVEVTAPTATDTCEGTITGTTSDPLEYSEQGTYFIAWTFDDGNGNSVTQEQTVIVDDTTAPVPTLAELPVVTGQCSVEVNSPTANDNCEGVILGTTTDPTSYSEQGTYTILWTYDDGNGNIATQEQTVIVDDTTAPVPTLTQLAVVIGQCAVEVTFPTATDTCEGTITGTTEDPLEYSEQGTYLITWTYDDGNGNTTTQEQTVIVDDTTAPVPTVTQLPVVIGQCSVEVTAPTADDNCEGVILGTTTDPTSYSEQGTYLITWTYDDSNGNTTTQEQTVIVDDTTAPIPTLVELPVANGQCSIEVTSPTANDNCEGVILGTTTDPTSYSEQGTYLITWTFDDGNGNTTTQEQTVIVDDTTAPAPTLAELPVISGQCSATVAAPTATDTCEGTITGTTSDPLEYSEQGTYLITWTYDDGNGNTTTQEQTVIVDDTTAPVPTLTQLPVASGQCSATVTAPTAADTCEGTITGTTDDPTSYSEQGTYTISWTFDDGNGNTTNQQQTVIVDDTNAPVPTLTQLAVVSGQCSATVTAPTATDTCEGTITGTTEDPIEYSKQGTYLITWTFDDGNGNTTTQEQTVIVDDTSAPVPIVTQLAVVSGQCSVEVTSPTANDNCEGVILGTTTDPTSYSEQGTYTILWTYDDGNGNIATQEQTVIVDDTTAPVPTLTQLAVVIGQCAVEVTFPTATDTCEGTITGTTEDPLEYSEQGTYLITWTYDDGNGNTTTQEQTVIVDDTTAPVPTLAELPVISGQCSATVTAPTATDTCEGTIIGTTEDPLEYSKQGTYLITWTFDDGNGNTTTQEQTVIVDDTSAPVPIVTQLAVVSGQCSVEVTSPTANDNCEGVILGTTTDPTSYSEQGTYLITWTYDDGNGNIATQEQTVIVDDTTAPVPTLAELPVISGQCSATVSAPTATDTCEGTITGTTEDPTSYSEQGTYFITWTYDDGNGNTATQEQTVIVDDTIAPVPTVTQLAVVSGQCSATVTAPTATDTCEGTITGTTEDPIEYSKQGTYLITWTFDDGNGNTTTQEQTVIVDDTSAPVPTLTQLAIDSGQCSVEVTSPTANDTCEGTITGTTTDPTSYSEQGTYLITWTYDDGNGNTTTQEQTVIVDDTTAPVPTVATLPTITGECSATVTAPKAADSCEGTITGTTSDPLEYSEQGTFTITWTFDDGNGNIATQEQTVIVDDTTAPDPTLAELPVVTGQCAVEVISPTANDNCEGVILGTTTDPTSYSEQGTYQITWTYDDGNGNISTQEQTVIVDDTTAPVPTVTQLAVVSGQCSVEVTSPTANDTCEGVILGTTTDPTSYSEQGTYLITWIFDDGNGNITTQDQTVIVDDTTAPVPTLAELPVISGQCSATVSAPTATDTCEGTITGTTEDPTSYSEQGTYFITWTYDDGNGNTTTQEQTVIVDDTTAPVPTLAELPVISGQCSATVTAPTATDTCEGTITGTTEDPIEYSEQGTYLISWTYDDGNGNTTTQEQTVIVDDTTAPVPIVTQLAVASGQCSVEVTSPTADDNCQGVILGTTTDPTSYSEQGTYLITWTYDDGNGNSVTQEQTVIVDDTTAPVPTVTQLAVVSWQCSVEVTSPTADDNCEGVILGTTSDPTSYSEQGTYLITWTYDDGNGNITTQEQTVNVDDTTAPVPTLTQLAVASGQCAVEVIAPTATDTCEGLITGTTTDPTSYSEQGTYLITWTYDDGNGNTVTQEQTVIVNDETNPGWNTIAGSLDRTLYCGQDNLLAQAQLLAPAGNDNCGNLTLQKTTGVFVPTGTNGAGTFTNTWIATDGNSNISEEFTQVITIAGLEIDASASGTPVQIGSTATLSAIVTPNVGGVTVNFYLDGLLKGSAVTNSSGIATLSVPGLQLNVYKVTAEVGNGCSESIAYLPVYDPNGSFVTGGGWINSPAGAYTDDPSLVGKASFGFVSKYKKGSNQVDGNTEFQFKAGNLNFKSTLHEAGTLVISGKKATYRGDGTINGVSGFRFTITAIDGNWNGGTLPDQFRIKIWGDAGVIYDNGFGAADNSEVATTLGGGSIVIHEAKGKGTKRVSAELITVDWNTPVETIKKKVDLMSATWFESRKLALTLDAGTYDPLTPGFYELKADLVENEFFELDEPIAIQVLVKDKSKALDIKLSGNVIAKNIANGTVIGTLSTLDPADDIHTYSMDAHPDLDILGNQLIWKGTNIPAAEMTVIIFSTDRAGQTISKEIKLSRELKPGEFFLYPNPAVNETNVMLDLDQSATVAFEVYDAIGRLVIQDEAYKEGSFTQILKLEGLAPGMYTVQLKVGNMVMTKRLIKN